MVSKAFFLFPGQGAQYTGMATDLLKASSEGSGVKHLFSLASEITGKDMAELLANSDAETLKRTDISQPAITLANLAAAVYLEDKGVKAVGSAGFSLGEYAALACAGVIGYEECFSLVTKRGKAMQNAVDAITAGGKEALPPGMAAVIGLAPEKVESLIGEWKSADSGVFSGLYAANMNSPRQTVISGTAEALAKAEALFAEAGARRFIRLQVAGPFHCPLMSDAAEEFRPFLESVSFKDPKIPLYSNFSGKRVFSGEEAKKLALAQITGPVRWTNEEASITADSASFGGIDMCLETGPGKVLQGLWKDMGGAVPCLAAGTADDIEKIICN